MFNNKSILITGGTGSFGKACIAHLLKKFPRIHRLAIYSRDENKQFEMQKLFSQEKFKCMRYFIGDVRDEQRLNISLRKIDYVIHAAAMKHVPASEYNPTEAIKTNINGAQNVINASLKNKVKKVLFLSTDKACSPINLYGATKLCAEKLFSTAKKNATDFKTQFITLRYGNVNASRGSVMPLFIEKSESGIIPITHKEMTRFSITMKEAIEMALWGLKNLEHGQTLIPKLPSYRVIDLAKVFSKCKIKFIGIRQGEKIHEDLIGTAESLYTIETKKYYILYPNSDKKKINTLQKKMKAKKVEKNFSYSSGTNKHFLNRTELSQIINSVKS
jgi:UDP-N-acetylglucosamine 4,6-dehydratase/5-epimerase